MRRLIYLPSAEDELDGIYVYLARRSANPTVAQRFVEALQSQCEKLASSIGTLGVARPDLRSDLRFIPFDNYSIFFRYCDDRLEIVTILESHRDQPAYFSER